MTSSCQTAMVNAVKHTGPGPHPKCLYLLWTTVDWGKKWGGEASLGTGPGLCRRSIKRLVSPFNVWPVHNSVNPVAPGELRFLSNTYPGSILSVLPNSDTASHLCCSNFFAVDSTCKLHYFRGWSPFLKVSWSFAQAMYRLCVWCVEDGSTWV